MKKYLLLFIIAFFSFISFAQKSKKAPTNKKTEKVQTPPDEPLKEDVVVVAYDVEESINMKFGGRKTTYTVSSLDLVDKNELGPDNTRVVRPKYVKVPPKEVAQVIEKLSAGAVVNTATVIEPVEVKRVIVDGKLQFIKIRIVENYERVLDKGYKTEEMLIAVGNYRFFAGDLDTAAKWYSQLFEFCPDELEAVYYYRYAKSLECIGQTEKAKEMMALYQIKK